ncbi:uncharacterized protein LOC118647191 [Monomorium pharaonis]|uniref:uncharacterized protein LOC118647191 n=1 Tax=Monomorium pharaonis TaxID=307658 RepID=UPI001745F634|nr:uncharacterized protein LOC118647191 [Monomorium pharaonis]
MSEEQCKELRKRRRYIKAKQTNIVKFAERVLHKQISPEFETLTIHADRLEKIHKEFEEIQQQLLVAVEEEEFPAEDQREDDEFEARYIDLKAFLTKKIAILRPTTSTATDANDAMVRILEQQTEVLRSLGSSSASRGTSNVEHKVKLPTIKLPSFSGEMHEWKRFSDSFTTLIHDSDLSPLEKHQYLNGALTGRAAKVVESIEISAENYEIAWSLLKARYEDEKALRRRHIQCLFDAPKVEQESAVAIQELIDVYRKHLRIVKARDSDVEPWGDAFVIFMIEERLDKATRRHWEETTEQKQEITIDMLFKFLQRRVQMLERLNESSQGQSISEEVKSNRRKAGRSGAAGNARAFGRLDSASSAGQLKVNSTNAAISLATVTGSGRCYVCKGAHLIYSCDKFVNLTARERIDLIKKLKLCFNCLRNDHLVGNCKASSCRTCGRRHNTLCHVEENNSIVERSANSESKSVRSENNQSEGSSVNLSVHHASGGTRPSQILMATAIVNATGSGGMRQSVRVLLDSASEANFITAAACSRLNVNPENVQEAITGINNLTYKVTKGCRVTVESRVTDYQLSVFCLIVPQITRNVPAVAVDTKNLSVTNNLKLADNTYFRPSQVDILIGGEFFLSLLEPQKIELGASLPSLHDTKLGWIISGPAPVQCVANNGVNLHVCLSAQLSLDRSIVKFWEIEDCSSRDVVLTEEEQACEKFFQETHARDRDGRFVVQLPFRKNKHKLGESRSIAEKRLMYLERKFRSNESFRRSYVGFMREYIDLRHMTVAPPMSTMSSHVVYLPHHGVYRDSDKKIRVVFDASCKTKSGVSLNDTLMVGAILQDSLIKIILRFRIHPIVITADLQKMYRQILVHDRDRDCQRVLWRFSPDDTIQEYRLNTVTYGQSCAPFLAIRSVRQLASENAARYPRAAQALLQDLYVDDVLTGVNDIAEAKCLIAEMVALLKLGQFELHKWRSSRAKELFDASGEVAEFQTITDERDDDKTLGIRWAPQTDNFHFKSTAMPDARTKRQLLSSISKLFDPLGLASPLVVKAKSIMQSTWQSSLGWDDELPIDLQKAWLDYMEELTRFCVVKVPRRVVGIASPVRVNLHAFCDASERAYGACAYVQAIDEANRVVSRLLCAKSRVAPVKKLTIPRLELCGAVILVDLIQLILDSLPITFHGVYAWSDSTIVLAWIAGDAGRQKTFVANRVAKIQAILSADHWRHVAGKENPADLISRGTGCNNPDTSSLWWSGPPWLSEIAARWQHRPRFPEPSDQELEIIGSEHKREIQVCVNQATSSSIIDEILSRFSLLIRIERIIAWCYRFISNARSGTIDRNYASISVEELKSARVKLVKHCQGQFFEREMRCLSGNRGLEAGSALVGLSPFVDENGVLRVGGRLQKAAMVNYNKKHPILLPARSRFTVLLLEREHRRMLHAGPQALLFSIREQYWPLNGRNLARKVVRECTTCFRVNPKPLNQIMGSLPSDRVVCRRAFTVVGVDYAGPLTTLMSRGRGQKTNKSYIAVFICFSTKAVHLEAIGDLTTDAFIGALRRFVGRRGHPQKIYSDNATNFVGARRELGELYKAIRGEMCESVNEYCTSRNIQWHFIPPHAPHMGGLWEAGVKSCKYHLKRIVGETRLTYEELNTVLVQVEACMNSRPLSQLSSHPNDMQPLTPAHFLIGEPLTNLPDIDLTDAPVNRLKRWQLIQRIAQHFWKRWSVEYLTSLQGKCKWTKERKNLAKDDIVLIVDENAPPLQWKMGRVLDLHPGTDGRVRVVTVKTSGNIVKRSITKLCKLPSSDD